MATNPVAKLVSKALENYKMGQNYVNAWLDAVRTTPPTTEANLNLAVKIYESSIFRGPTEKDKVH